MRWSETKDCVQPKCYLAKIKNRKRHILVFVFRMQNIGSSQCDYNVAMCNGIRFNRKSTQCICFVYYGAGRNVRCVYGSNETSWPKEHFSTFLSSLVCQICIKICVAVQKLYKNSEYVLLCTCIGVHYAMPNSINAIFIWIRLFIYVVNCSFTRIGWIT